MNEEKEMYPLICKDRFDRLEEMQQETLRLLRGKDSEPGLVDDVRGLKRAYKKMIGAGIFLLGVISVQIIGAVVKWISGSVT